MTLIVKIDRYSSLTYYHCSGPYPLTFTVSIAVFSSVASTLFRETLIEFSIIFFVLYFDSKHPEIDCSEPSLGPIEALLGPRKSKVRSLAGPWTAGMPVFKADYSF